MQCCTRSAAALPNGGAGDDMALIGAGMVRGAFVFAAALGYNLRARAVSSGVERFVDTEEVIGAIPIAPTISRHTMMLCSRFEAESVTTTRRP